MSAVLSVQERAQQIVAPQAVPGSEVLQDVYDHLGRFVSYPSTHARVAHALWIAHTYKMDVWESTPRLAFLSPEPGSGKTRALEVTESLVPNPVEQINSTPAYIFRRISGDTLPTILFDEIDTVFGPKAKENEELRGIINAGHRKGAKAGRCVIRGKTVETEELDAYCALAVAGLGNLPDTILTRSVIVRMRRRGPGENVEPYRRRIHQPQGNAIAAKLQTWAESITIGGWPDMPAGIEDRDADVWEALLAMADAAGGDWPTLAREAAISLVNDSKDRAPSLGVRLLSDLRSIFAERASMTTEDLLRRLVGMEEAPWADMRGKPIDARRLARHLQPYGISSTTIRTGPGERDVAKGYRREDLHDQWARYLPPPKAGTSVTGVTAVTPGDEVVI